MARQIEDIVQIEQEIYDLEETIRMAKSELKRIVMEYLEGAISLSEQAIEEISEEIDTVILSLENGLF